MWFGDVEKFEHECVYEIRAKINHLNENHVMKPAGYQELFLDLVEKELDTFRINFTHTLEYGIAWVVISFSIDIVKPITDSMWLYGSTWYSQRRGPYFRRELIFKNAEGEVMFQGTTYNILLSVKDRGIFRKTETPFYLDPPHPEFCAEGTPSFKKKYEYEDGEKRVARGSDLDCLGHVNNCRYGAYAYDALSKEEKERLSKLRRMELYFEAELREGDEFLMQKTWVEDDLLVRCRNLTSDSPAFDMVLKFHP